MKAPILCFGFITVMSFSVTIAQSTPFICHTCAPFPTFQALFSLKNFDDFTLLAAYEVFPFFNLTVIRNVVVRTYGQPVFLSINRFLLISCLSWTTSSNPAADKRTVYYSHETFSPRKGGCACAEKTALESTFGDNFRDVKVINTKGMTGHTLGASIEEAVAAKLCSIRKFLRL